MGDEQAVKLLEEIRDLQREALANQKIALQNQQASLQNQQESIARQKTVLQRNKVSYVVLIFVVLILAVSFLIPVVALTFRWIMRW
jgi:cell division protein FtsL